MVRIGERMNRYTTDDKIIIECSKRSRDSMNWFDSFEYFDCWRFENSPFAVFDPDTGNWMGWDF